MYLFLTTYSFYVPHNQYIAIYMFTHVFFIFLLISPMELYMMIMNTYVQLCFEDIAVIIKKIILN
jgi:hypothetical protein